MSGFKLDIKKVDKGLAKFEKKYRSFKGRSVKIGLLASKSDRSEDTLTNPELGVIHEFGTEDIPARPFINPSFEQHKRSYVKLALKIAEKTSVDVALGQVGAKAAADMKNRVTEGDGLSPGLAESTIRAKMKKSKKGAKNDPKPLIDTGQMINSITWKVE